MPLTINGGKIRKEGGNSPYGGFRSSIDTESAQATLITAESEQPPTTETVTPEQALADTSELEGPLFPDK
jgi:hypothetical protein